MLNVSGQRMPIIHTQSVLLTGHAGNAARAEPLEDDAERAVAAKVATMKICRNIMTAFQCRFLGRDDASWGDDGIQKILIKYVSGQDKGMCLPHHVFCFHENRKRRVESLLAHV